MKLPTVLQWCKGFCRRYVIAPESWRLLALIIGRLRGDPAYTTKQKRQYPYNWAGEVVSVSSGGTLLPGAVRQSLKLVTRNLESKVAFQPVKGRSIAIGPLPEETSSLLLAVTTKSDAISAKNLEITDESGNRHLIKGQLIRDAWQHLRVSVPPGADSVRLSFHWEGGQLNVADPVAERRLPEAAARLNQDGKPSVIVLVLDSMMSTSIGCLNDYRREQSLTPQIDRFFENGMLFRNAYSVSEYTMPSLATMATGLYPIEHGVFTHDRCQREMPRGIPTLAETMRESGYRTFGYSTGGRFSPLYGHFRGFDRFLLHNMNHTNTADMQVSKAVEFMEAHHDAPSFCFLHFIDPHPPFPLPTYFSDLQAGEMRWGDSRDLYSAFKLHRDSSALIDELRTVETYMIRNIDMILAKLFAWLSYSGRSEDTYVLLLADHGREYRKGSPLLTKSLTHIPFLVSGPGIEPGIRDAFTEAPLDLYPVIMGLSGIKPPSHLSGLDVVGNKDAGRSICLSESLFRRTGEIVLRNENWLYGLRCEFDYLEANFKFGAVEGEWLYPRRHDTGAEDYTANQVSLEKEKVAAFREFAARHYGDRPRYFDDSNILEFSRNYPE